MVEDYPRYNYGDSLAGPLFVEWFNHRRLHGEITDDDAYTSPAEFEAVHFSQNPAAQEAVTQ